MNEAASGRAVVRVADLAGTFVFAVEGAFAAIHAGFDPVGIVTLAFVTALGGGIVRDLLIGGMRPAAIADWHYPAIVLGAALVSWIAHPVLGAPTGWTMIVLDAAGLALFAVAGTQKALDHAVHPLPAIFLGTVGAVGGGAVRDVLLGEVPRILHVDIYASAAALAAALVALTHAARRDPRLGATLAAGACFALRIAAVAYGWQLPRLIG